MYSHLSCIDAIKKFKDLATNKTVFEIITREIAMLRSLRSKFIVDMKEVINK